MEDKQLWLGINIEEGGILFWCHGNLRDWPGILNEIGLLKD